MSINDIVNVQISRETRAVSRQGFSTILVLGLNKAFIPQVKVYASTDEVLEDFLSTSPEYLAAKAIFDQQPSVINLKIGRLPTADLSVGTITNVLNNTQYSITINGQKVTITSDSDATGPEIVAALKVAVDALSEPITFTDNLDGTYDITPNVVGAPYSVKIDTNQSIVFTLSGTIADGIASIQNEDDDWYGLVYTLRVQADQEAIASYIESQKKSFVTASDDSDIIDVADSLDSTSLAAVFKAAGYARSMVFYLSNAATQFPEAAYLGTVLPLDPGSWTGKFKSLTGITIDQLTPTQRTNALAKYANVYESRGGAPITQDGKVSANEYHDIIVFVDWLESRITEEVYVVLINNNKVPYTDKGITLIQAAINRVLLDGVSLGGIAEDPEFIITVPVVEDISAIDKANRVLNNIKFQATLAGAIHVVNIQGVVSL